MFYSIAISLLFIIKIFLVKNSIWIWVQNALSWTRLNPCLANGQKFFPQENYGLSYNDRICNGHSFIRKFVSWIHHTGRPESHVRRKEQNFECHHYDSTKRAQFFLPRIEVCSYSKSIRTRLVTTFVKYYYRPHQENFYFFSDTQRKKYT